ncbi:glycosyltransferase [Clostridium perfringens]|uniref:glycosyltransferase n=1 Tax=Clostridium perfringens TaxID=1502 RepID=UPI0037550566|nr:glycosyltransferase [Clostridium perfringens]
MKKVNILVDGMCPGKGGVQEYLINIYRNIDNKKFKFDFIVCGKECDYEEEIKSLGGEVYYIEERKKNVFKNILGYYKIINKNKYDIFYHNLSVLYYNVPFVISIIKGIKHNIVHAHNTKSDDMSLLYYLLHKLNRVLINKYSDKKLMCSKLAGDWIFGLNDNNEERIMIANAVDINKFKYNYEKSKIIKKSLGVNDELIIGHVGRFSYQKNHEFLIDVFYNLKKKLKKTKLVLIGDGELKEKIKEKVIKMEIEDDIIFLGNRNDVNELLQGIDIFLMPSRFEGLSVVLIEAQTSGLPCLISDKITKEAAITPNIEYLSIDNGVELWVDKIISIKNSFKRSDQSENIIRNGFEIKSSAKKVEEIMDDVLIN